MAFEIIWTKRAKKDLKLLDKPTAQRVFNRVEALGKQGTVFLEKVQGRDFYKFRIGKYRVFIDKFPATSKLAILHIRHRRNAYKNI